MNIWVLALTKAVVYTLVAISVRIQHSLFRSFDFSVAAAIVAASEMFTQSASMLRMITVRDLPLLALVSIVAAVSILSLWSQLFIFFARKSGLPSVALGSTLFVSSLGFSSAFSGLVGLLRGPGLRQSALNNFQRFAVWNVSIEVSSLYGLLMGCSVLAIAFYWLHRPGGMGLFLLAEDEEFAIELGVERRSLILSSTLVGGAAAGVTGSFAAFSSGSTPDIGLVLFLYGAGAALIFPSPSFGSCLLGGLVVGALDVCLQLIMAPSWATALIFSGIVALLMWRGTSRTRQGVR